MSHDHPGQDDNPSGGRDEFDHFFTDRGATPGHQDPDATAWAGRPYDADQTQTAAHAPYVRPPHQQPRYDEYPPAEQTEAVEHTPYVRPPQEPQYDEYEPAGQGYYPPAGYYQEPPQRKSTMWAPVAVIVASLAIVAVVIAFILNNSTGRMTQGAFTPTATVTETTTPTQSSGASSSPSPKSSTSHSSSSSSAQHYATSLPGSASSCPGSDSYGTGPKTSCGFAAVVATLYNAKKDSDGNASFRAKSPTTHDKYNVSCHEDSYATCTTDTGAIVYVLHK